MFGKLQMQSRKRFVGFSCGLLIFSAAAFAQQTATVDVAMGYQTLEGWGTNLGWFANGIGSWSSGPYGTATAALFDPVNGLGLTYLAFLIHGGNDPQCGTSGHYACINYPANVPGYEPTQGNYDWTQDAQQRAVTKTAQSFGADIIDAVSYSPPYWMTNSGTSEGGANGSPNLASAYYGSGAGSFVDYLTTVAQHYAQNWGVTFTHIDPFNEPTGGWWTAGSTKQEGCGFDYSQEASILQSLAASLASKGLISQVGAMDENQEGANNGASTAGESNTPAATSWFNYDATTQGDVTALETHAYGSGNGSVALYTDALHSGKRLVMHEWGSPDNTGSDLSHQVLADLNSTRAVAFLIWQPDWPGLWNIDYANQTVSLNEAYYAYKSFTKFIRPGFQVVAVSDPNSLAAFNQRTQTLVLVTVNYSSSNQNYTYNLPKFASLGTTASVYRTSSTEQMASLGTIAVSGTGFSYTANAGSVTTYVINASYQPAVTTVNDNTTGTGNNQFNYSGSWSYWSQQSGAYDSDNHWSSNPNDTYTLQFTGQQARLYGAMVNSNGIAAISVDNGAETYVDTYAANRVDDVFLYATPTLAYGSHTLKVRVTGLKHPASTGTVVNADRIDVVSTVNEVGQGIYYINNTSNNQVLDAYNANMNNPGTVGLYTLNNGINQRWNLMASGDGSYRIVNVNSGEDLDVSQSSTANGAGIDQYEDKGAWSNANQRWYISSNGDGTYTIKNVNSGLNLEVNASKGNLDQYQNTNTANQHWTLVSTN